MSKRLPTPAEAEARLREIYASRKTAPRPDQDPKISLDLELDLDQPTPVGGFSSQTGGDLDPDGLGKFIRGAYRELLTTDPDYLQARAWKCLPATLTNATKRMGADWVRQQICFVRENITAKKIRHPGKYLSHLLAKNPY